MLAVYDFFGAYFPAWLPAMVIGLGATVVLRSALGAWRIVDRMPVPLLAYMSSVVLFTCLAWFVLR
jgi:hypothetical protein